MLKIEPLVWKTMAPPEFRCFLCGKNQAEWKVKLHTPYATFRSCVCTDCIRVHPQILSEKIANKGGGKID